MSECNTEYITHICEGDPLRWCYFKKAVYALKDYSIKIIIHGHNYQYDGCKR